MTVTEDEARQKAMTLLARRDCSRAMLARRLSAMGAEPSVIESVLEQLRGWGYLNDDRMAASLTRRKVGQGLGPRRIRHELREAGLPGEIPPEGLGEALAGGAGGVDDLSDPQTGWKRRAREVWRRRFGEMPAADPREHARRVRYMMARGFTWDQIRACFPGKDEDEGFDPESDD